MIEEKRTSKVSVCFLAFSIFFSIVSQIEEFEYWARPLMYIFWIASFAIIIINNGFCLRFSYENRVFFSFVGLYCAYCLIMSLSNNLYLQNNYLLAIPIPIFMLLIGDNLNITDTQINKLIKLYCIFAFAFGVYIILTKFNSYTTWISTSTYSFSRKNSASQIWGSALIASVFLIIPNEKKSKKIIWCAIVGLLLVAICFSQCRTSLFGLCLSFAFVVVFKSKKKIRWILFFAVVILAIIFIPSLNSFFDKVILIDRFQNSNLDNFSSGRLSLYKKAIENIANSLIVGKGNYYVDCSYLMILAESGIIGFVLIEVSFYNRIFCNLMKTRKTRFEQFMVSICAFYVVESFLEGLPPFGPGVSTFFFWLISGIVMQLSIREEMLESESFE